MKLFSIVSHFHRLVLQIFLAIKPRLRPGSTKLLKPRRWRQHVAQSRRGQPTALDNLNTTQFERNLDSRGWLSVQITPRHSQHGSRGVVCIVLHSVKLRNVWLAANGTAVIRLHYERCNYGSLLKKGEGVKFSLLQATKAQRRSRCLPLPFKLGDRWKLLVKATPLLPMYQEAERASASVWMGLEISFPHEGFERRTVQPIASHYTDYAIPTQQLIHLSP